MDRDQMFSRINELSSQIASVLAPLQARQAALEAEIAEQERPRKQLEAVQQQMAIAQGPMLDEKFRLQRAVREAMPEFLRVAIADTKAQAEANEVRATQEINADRRAALRARGEQCRAAEHALEKLVSVPGDLNEAVRKILVDLALAGTTTAPAAPPAEPAPAAPRRRPQYAEAAIES